MCARCDKIDTTIGHYQKLAKAILDKPLAETIGKSIAAFEAEKLALHPKQDN